jgi:hypothetical protein
MTDYRVTFIKDLVAIDAYVRIEDEERQAIEENIGSSRGGPWQHIETLLVRRAEELVREKVHSTDFYGDNWDWEIEEL